MRQRILPALGVVLIAASGATAADVAAGAKVSTLGYGIELTGRLARTVNVRAAFHPGPSYSHQFTESDTAYDFDIRLLSVTGGLDWHPTGGAFHLSAGLLSNQNELSAAAAPATTLEIGEGTYAASDVGSLLGTLKFKAVAPYVGLGFGNSVGEGKRLGVVFDSGVVFAGSPDVKLTASGPVANQPGFKVDLAAEEAEIKDGLAPIKYYPIVSLTLTYKF